MNTPYHGQHLVQCPVSLGGEGHAAPPPPSLPLTPPHHTCVNTHHGQPLVECLACLEDEGYTVPALIADEELSGRIGGLPVRGGGRGGKEGLQCGDCEGGESGNRGGSEAGSAWRVKRPGQERRIKSDGD